MKPVAFVDRAERALVLRALRPQDAPALFVLNQALIWDGEGMVLIPEEAHSPEELARRIAEVHRHGGLFLGAFEDEELVGSLDLARIPRSMLRHNASLGMGIHPDYQGVGLGRRLLTLALAWAQEQGISRVELFVRSDNLRAQQLYVSLGFVPIHLRKAFVRLPDGSMLDDLYMEWLDPDLEQLVELEEEADLELEEEDEAWGI